MTNKVITVNRKARYDYDILDTIQAGMVLTGTEIKSIRAGNVNIRESYVRPHASEIWLYNCHISQYESGNVHNHDPVRTRKLLLTKPQIHDITLELGRTGLTAVPLRIIIKNHHAKVDIGIARGRRKHEKKRAIIDKYKDREARQAIKRRL